MKSTTAPETVLSKIDKLLNMVRRAGTSNEAQTAQKLLDQLCKKYDINLDDLVFGEEVRRYYFKGYGINQRLLIQIIKKVNRDLVVYTCNAKYHGNKGSVYTECTFAESVEIKEMYDHYKRLFAKQSKLFYLAFIFKNDLGLEPKEGEESKSSKKMSTTELAQMMEMMSSIEKNSPKKKLAA